MRPSEDRLRTTSQASRLAFGSNPVVGSSRNKQLGIADQAEAEVEPTLLATGELPHAGVLLLLEADEIDHLERIAGMGVVDGAAGEGLADGEELLDGRLLQDDADPLEHGPPLRGRIEAEHPHLAGVALGEALHDLDRRRLAGPVRAEQGEDRARLDDEVHTADGMHVSE